MNWYQRVVNDVIFRTIEVKGEDDFKHNTIVVISIPGFAFLLPIMSLIQRHLTGQFYKLKFLENILIRPMYIMVEGIILYILPVVIFNYYYIFYKDKYLVFLDKSSYKGVKLIVIYYVVFFMPMFITLGYALLFGR